ncbi:MULTISPECIES: SDR family NAD(P)-dependent oxidoreductase [Acinetobacter]|uniref:SDR family NAD(P)-dependent oxidoreductase n=1 Tax=Acinetobacter TaxID=469 RepID=UPI0007183A2F|nr:MULTISPECIES: glucose 1-dehydrogenase [Acinetobacter]EKV3807182.1 glucose 1-dehydrogenase [Acinetobacter baumannii]EKW1172961.1 glucose 1-dehydrogenase [Acinetobacter baumannii]KRW26785.1 2-hydroxypropyl-CoM dehydrogenase [Acinetobacter baumannii]MBU3816694.1 glucose 1-dehydrogenase [Acinetobacter baumannii]MCO9051079.1 glucose 1-dehydrogenase [Acinetobacter sp. UC24323]
MSRLQNKVCIITGAASGMGESEAIAFAQQGAKLIIADMNLEQANQVAENIINAGGEAFAFRVDVTQFDQLKQLVEFTLEKFGRIDVLLNNAGIFDKYTNSLDTTEELWDTMFAINVKAVFNLSNLVLPKMIEQGSGAIINIASIAGLVAQMGGASYTASKHAVIGYTKHLAAVYAKHGIKINAICPGTIRTPMTAKMLETRPTDKIPLDRFGEASEVAELAIFLASDEARFMNGSCITIDGGYTII